MRLGPVGTAGPCWPDRGTCGAHSRIAAVHPCDRGNRVAETAPGVSRRRYAPDVTDPGHLESRVGALEVRVEEAAADAAVARHLAAARDLDLADFAIRIDANSGGSLSVVAAAAGSAG